MNSKRRLCYGVMILPAALTRRLREEWRVVESPGRTRVPPEVDGARQGRELADAGNEKRPLAA